MTSRARAFTFTWNNYDAAAPDTIRSLGEHPCIRYLCYQREVGESGTPHIQGYLYCGSLKTIKQVVDLFTDICSCHPHIEIAKGSPTQNREYCSKEGPQNTGFTEFGIIPVKGTKPCLTSVCQDLVSRKRSLHDVALTDPSVYVKHFKGLQALIGASFKGRDGTVVPTVKWYFGPTGTGKSRKAFSEHPGAYVKMGNNTWWDLYQGETTVIIDDYRVNMCTFDYLLRLLDRYPMIVEVKGDTVRMNATTFVITAPQRPEVMWFLNTEEAVGQLLRRISEIWEFTSEDDPPTVMKNSSITYIPNSVERMNQVELFREKRTYPIFNKK